jgi:hypothetical protein
MVRKFFFAAAGMFLLALSYHLSASTATAQAPGNPVVGISGYGNAGVAVLTANGDVYVGDTVSPWRKAPNVFGAGPTPALRETWGSLKSRYQNTPGMTVTPGADKR